MLDAEIGFDARLIQPTTNYFHLQHTKVNALLINSRAHIYFIIFIYILKKWFLYSKRLRDECAQIFIEINFIKIYLILKYQ